MTARGLHPSMPDNTRWAVHFERWPVVVIYGFDTPEEAHDWITENEPDSIDCRVIPTIVTGPDVASMPTITTTLES